MLKEFIWNHACMSGIFAVGMVSLLLQAVVAAYLKGYARATANMKTTKKKLLLMLKNQYEAMYSMDCRVKNTGAYVDKFLLKLRLCGIPLSVWEKLPFLTAGIVMLLTVAGMFLGYERAAGARDQMEILFSGGIVLACLFLFFHILGIKSRKEQIQIQLVDYLENYMVNRLARSRDSRMEMLPLEDGILPDPGEEAETERLETPHREEDASGPEDTMEEDMEMLKRLLSQVEQNNGKPEKGERVGKPLTTEVAVSEESDAQLLEEFVQSFLA